MLRNPRLKKSRSIKYLLMGTILASYFFPKDWTKSDMELMVNYVGFLFVFSLLIITSSGGFIKFGPCLFGWRETCPDSHINFYLYTRKNLNTPQKLLPDKNVLSKSNYNPKNPNKMIIHGYNSDMNLFQLLRMKNDYLNVSDYNIWMIDWSEVAAGPCYPVVVSNLNYVGKCIAQLVKEILEISTVPKESAFHLIGFSVGAHLAAYVGNHVRPYKFSRITGLDPALPLFTTPLKDSKLDETDAAFVDVLHTDALKEGKVEACGHVDFYVNGGIEQPGCTSNSILDTSRCNHYRAAAYFAESIKTQIGFYGWFCEGFFHYVFNKCPPISPNTLMGEHVNKTTVGSFILHTANKDPFAIGKNYSVDKLEMNFPAENNFLGNDLTLAYVLNTVNNSFNALEVSLAASKENVTLFNVG